MTTCGQRITIDGYSYTCEQNGLHHDFHKFTGLNGARIWVENKDVDSPYKYFNSGRKDYATKMFNDPAATDVAHLLAIVVLQLLEISEKIS